MIEGGFEAWPALDELFPVTIQGVNHNRGIEGTVIDYDKTVLESRLKAYIAAPSFEVASASFPELAPPGTTDGKPAIAGYEPKDVWKDLQQIGFDEDRVKPFLAFPLDQRWIYYETRTKLLNRPRPEYESNLSSNEFLLTVPEPRKETETRPLFATTLANLHVHERGSVVFPRDVVSNDLLAHRDANIAEPTWRRLRDHFGLSSDRSSDEARALVGKLFRIAFAVLHAPTYQAEHKSALGSDWAHLPIPKDATLWDNLVRAGEKVVRLLDANRDARDIIEAVLSPERAKHLAQLRRADGGTVTAGDLQITVTYWGGGKGRWKPRPFLEDEQAGAGWDAWGEQTGDLYLNDHTYLAHVPEAVWLYQLGGYPVLKKWLGYRQADRRNGSPLSDDERRWLRQMVQRIAALEAMGPSLDALYQDAATDSFTAVDLELRT